MSAALWFSGGKDSMACLYLYRDEPVTVLWCNTGKNYPELLATVARAKAIAPAFVEVEVDRDRQWGRAGLPSDLIPMDWTVDGQMMTSRKPFAIQSYVQCCYENIAAPLMAKTKELGCNTVIRGQRDDESHRATTRHGDTCDGITFLHPIEDWTREQVMDYLKAEMGELPEHYALEHSSMDCYDCTAYSAHSADRVTWMRERHPALYQDYRRKAGALLSAIAPVYASMIG